MIVNKSNIEAAFITLNTVTLTSNSSITVPLGHAVMDEYSPKVPLLQIMLLPVHSVACNAQYPLAK